MTTFILFDKQQKFYQKILRISLKSKIEFEKKKKPQTNV